MRDRYRNSWGGWGGVGKVGVRCSALAPINVPNRRNDSNVRWSDGGFTVDFSGAVSRCSVILARNYSISFEAGFLDCGYSIFRSATRHDLSVRLVGTMGRRICKF
jgi:hypothetical protein